MNIPIIISNSPVEFVLTGPFCGSDQVLVKSDNAGLDLVGVAAEAPYHERRNIPSWISLFYPRIRVVNVTRGHPFIDIVDVVDARPSNYYFAWAGQTRASGQIAINELLEHRLPAIVLAIRNHELGALEWNLSAAITILSHENNYNKARRSALRIFVTIYAAAAALALALEMASKAFH